MVCTGLLVFFFNDTATTEIYTLSLHDALPIFVRTIERNKLYQAQTPQMFRIGLLKTALEKVVEDNDHITDEAEAIERLGHSIKIVLSSKSNIKITHSDDLKLANYYLNKS